jgi:hypothetical protein
VLTRAAEELNPPSARCYVCGTQGIVHVRADCGRATFREFADRVLRARLGFVAPSVTVGTSYAAQQGEAAAGE